MDRTLVPEPLQPPTLGPLEEREKALALSARQARWSLLQSRVLCFGLLQDGDVGVGVFPECEEILKRGASFAGVALHSIGAGQAQMCEESAGKRRRRSITPGNRWLKQALVQAAWAASHSKNTYLASQYRRVAGHRGKKRALIAVGHSILVIFYHTIKSGTSHAELGGDFFDRLEPERLARYYLKRLERLGATKSRSNPAQLHERNFRSRKSLYGLPLFEDRPVLRDTTPRTN